MIINRIDINPILVIPKSCRGSYMVQKTLKSGKTCVNMRSIELKNSDKMGPTHSTRVIITTKNANLTFLSYCSCPPHLAVTLT